MNKLQAVLRRRWPILVAALALGLVAGALTQALSPKRELTQYQADQVIVGNRNADNPVNVEQDALRVNRGEVLAAAADELNIEDSDDIAGKVQVKADKDSNSISLRVYDADPATASEIVQAFADAFLTIVNAELRADDQRLLDELTARATEAQQALARFDEQNGFISRPDVALPKTPTVDALVAERKRLSDAATQAQARLDQVKLQVSQQQPYSSLGPEAPRVADSQLLEVPSSIAFRAGLLGLIALALAAGLIVIIERVNARVDTRAELADLTRVPIIAEVGRIRGKRIPKMDGDRLSLEGVWSEHYRRVRSAIQFVQANPNAARPDQLLTGPAPASDSVALRGSVISAHTAGSGESPKVFMFISALPSEGKSTSTALTAMALAESGVETVTINADFRRPRLDDYLGSTPRPSLADAGRMDVDRATVDEVVQQGPQPHLWTVASGSPTTDVGNRLQAAREVAAEAARRGATVLIDSSPLRVSNDPIDLLQVVDEVILVVRAGKSTVKSLQDTLEQLQMHHAPVMGVVLIGTSGSREMYAYYSSYYTEIAPPEGPDSSGGTFGGGPTPVPPTPPTPVSDAPVWTPPPAPAAAPPVPPTQMPPAPPAAPVAASTPPPPMPTAPINGAATPFGPNGSTGSVVTGGQGAAIVNGTHAAVPPPVPMNLLPPQRSQSASAVDNPSANLR
jgi:Mrp family chromosome partitioning ATPase/capsular polysaccharide biosynthesis protein